MKAVLFSLLAFASITSLAQKKTSAPVVPDVAAMQKMTPAEREAYKQKLLKQATRQAKDMARQYNLKLDETDLPDFTIQPPPKDFSKLSLIPKQPPTMIQLADALRQTKKEIEAVTPKPILEEVRKITEVQSPAEQQSSSIAAFYGDKPAEALLISISSALQSLDELTGLNNLGAMLNMVKMEHKAVPILMNALQLAPNNSMLLNNMGQAYLGMGDLFNAEEFLKRCLAEDDMHPEANHSMGLLKFFRKEYEDGMKYFEKELQVAYRGSTLAMLKKQGKTIDLYKLREKAKRLPGKNYFEEVNLNGFKIPAFPGNFEETRLALMDAENFAKSVQEEMLFWNQVSNELINASVSHKGDTYPGIYHELVKVMLDDFDGLFPVENRSLFRDEDLDKIQEMYSFYELKLRELKEQLPPAPREIGGPVYEAWQVKVCDMKGKIVNQYMGEHNSFVSTRIATVLPRWRHYINGLINIVSLDPSEGNKLMVYRTVQAYFAFLSHAWGSGKFMEPPVECDTRPAMTPEEAEELLKSARNLTINCPSWLNIEIDLKAAKLKADCSKYAIEIGKGLQASYEKDFKTGRSTLSAGVGAKEKFWHLGKVSAKAMLYISYDNNNEFADFGVKGQAGAAIGLESDKLAVDEIGKIASEIAGAEAGFTLGISSGFNPNVKLKGILAPYNKK